MSDGFDVTELIRTLDGALHDVADYTPERPKAEPPKMRRSRKRITDIDAAVTIARDDLAWLADALPSLWEDRYADEWRPECYRGSKPRSVELWTGPPAGQALWLTIARHIATGSHRLLDDTDVPAGWTTTRLLGVGDEPGAGSTDAHRWGEEVRWVCARVPGFGEVHRGVRLLSAMLEWCRGQWKQGELAPPEAEALLHACEEAMAAHEALPEPMRRPKPRICSNGICMSPARGQRAECAACARFRQRRGFARPIRPLDETA